MKSISSLPVDWKKDALLSIVDPGRPITYGVVQPGERLKQGIPIIRGQDYSRGIVDDSDLYLIHPNIAAAYKRSSVRGGDILFSIVGYLGQTAVVPPTLSGANITQTTARIAVNSPNQSKFFLHQFRSELFAFEVRKYQKGSAQPGLNLSDVEKMLVVIPPPHEQSCIAAVLDTVDDAIAKTEAVIAKLKQVRAGLLHNLLTRGLDENGQLRDPIRHPEQFQDSPLGRIPREWDVKPIGDIADVTKLAGFEFTNTIHYSDSGEIIALRALNIKDERLDLSDIQRIPKSASDDLPRSKVFAGDILITYIGAYIGDVLLITESDRFHLAPNVAKVTVKNATFPEFLQWQLRSARTREQMRRLIATTATPSLTMTQIRKLRVGIPRQMEEQRNICSQVYGLDEAIRLEELFFENLRSLKSGLMNDLLTGRVPVPASLGLIDAEV